MLETLRLLPAPLSAPRTGTLPASAPLQQRVCPHPLGAGRMLSGRAVGDLQRISVRGQRQRRGRCARGVSGLHPPVHPGAHRAHGSRWSHRSHRPHGGHGSCRCCRPHRARRRHGPHGRHGRRKRWTTKPGFSGKKGGIWCAFDAEHPVQYTNFAMPCPGGRREELSGG